MFKSLRLLFVKNSSKPRRKGWYYFAKKRFIRERVCYFEIRLREESPYVKDSFLLVPSRGFVKRHSNGLFEFDYCVDEILGRKGQYISFEYQFLIAKKITQKSKNMKFKYVLYKEMMNPL